MIDITKQAEYEIEINGAVSRDISLQLIEEIRMLREDIEELRAGVDNYLIDDSN